MTYKLAFRNILRNKRRTILTVLMMSFGFVLFSMFISLTDGVYGSIINQFIVERTGHVQVHKKDYLNRPTITKLISNYESLYKKLSNNSSVMFFAPRVKGNALAFEEKGNFGVSVIGIDPKLESKLTGLHRKITLGTFQLFKKTVVVGKTIKEVFNLNIGDQLVLISQGADGSIANDIFVVSGIIAPKEESFNDQVVYMNIKDAQQFFSLANNIHEVAIRLNENIAIDFSKKFNKQLDENLTVSPWQVVESDFYKAMEADKKGDLIGQMIFMLVVVIGVLNTVLMSILERTQEFGVLKAIGTRPIEIFKLILFETAYIGIISTILGALLSVLVNYYLSTHGIEFEPFEFGGMRFDKMLGVINIRTFTIPFVTIFISSIFVSIFPAVKAARVSPIKAMRSI